MRTIIWLVIIIFICYNFDAVENFVIGNYKTAEKNTVTWMKEHTPNK